MHSWVNEWVPQLGAGILALTATIMVCSKGKYHKWGYPVGLAAQPFWFWMTIKDGQWVIFILSVCYTVSWINGIRNYFMKRGKTNEQQSPVKHIGISDSNVPM